MRQLSPAPRGVNAKTPGAYCFEDAAPGEEYMLLWGRGGCQTLPATSSARILSPRFVSYMASYDVANTICLAHCPPRHRHAFCTFAS